MKCNICHHQTKLINDTEQKKEYLLCENCQIIQLKREFIIEESLEKKQYDYHNNNFENRGYVEMFENFLELFWEKIEKRDSALDFGSGPTPVLAKILENRGFKNVDFFDKFYQPDKIYTDKKYDLITSTEVFEHLHNPIEILNLLKSHLKDNGLLAIMTLFHTNKSEEFLNWWYRRDPTHITFYTPHSFEVLANVCGLRVIFCDNKRVIVLSLL